MDDHLLFFLLRRILLPAASLLIVLTIVGGLMLWARLKRIWTRRTRTKDFDRSALPENGQLSSNSSGQAPGPYRFD